MNDEFNNDNNNNYIRKTKKYSENTFPLAHKKGLSNDIPLNNDLIQSNHHQKHRIKITKLTSDFPSSNKKFAVCIF